MRPSTFVKTYVQVHVQMLIAEKYCIVLGTGVLFVTAKGDMLNFKVIYTALMYYTCNFSQL